MSIHKDRLRAQLVRGAQRHGRVHAELAGFVGCCRHHATLVSATADHDGLAAQRRIKQLFHRDKERVHVNVEDHALVSRSAVLGRRDEACLHFGRRC